MKTYVLLGFGTFGKSVVTVERRLAAFYERQPLPSLAFDSDPGDLLSAFVLPVPESGRLDVAFDGQDLRDALRRGEYPRLAGLDRDFLKTTKTQGGFGLYPPLGLAAATLSRRTLRDALRQLCQTASDIVTAAGGEIVVIRCFSSFGGTSRGLVWESGEALLDLARETGLRIHVLDLVAIPGFATATSGFLRHYLRNTQAFVTEAAALRSEAFHRLLWDDQGRPDAARTAVLPSTLVLVSDTNGAGQSLSVELQVATVARFVDLLGRPAFSQTFWGTHADLIRHGTEEPFAARLGLYSLFAPTREATLARRYDAFARCLEGLVEAGETADETARGLLGRLGLWAPNAMTLRLFGRLKERLVAQLERDPVGALDGLFAHAPDDYFTEYWQLVEGLRTVDTETLAREIAEEIEKSGILDEELTQLKAAALPGALLATLREAVRLLEADRRDLTGFVESAGEARIEEEEQAAGTAQDGFRALRRRWWRRRGRIQDALEQVKTHLVAALARRVDVLVLRMVASVLDKVLTDLRAGALPAWDRTAQGAEALLAAIRALKADIESRAALALTGRSVFRGAGTSLAPVEPRAADAPGEPDPQALLEGVRPHLPALHGAARDAVHHALRQHLWPAITTACPPRRAPLTAEGLTEAAVREALDKAAPLAPVDETVARGLRARFVVARGGDASGLRPLAARVVAGTGPGDRERWIDLGPELEDELLVVTFEEGVRLRAFRGLVEAREVYRKMEQPEQGHLEPLFGLLPDPLADELEEERLVLLGLLGGTLRRTATGLRYVGDDGTEHPLDAAELARYERVVAIVSRVIARLRQEGFAALAREIHALAGSDKAGDAARSLLEDLRRWARWYHAPLPDESGVAR